MTLEDSSSGNVQLEPCDVVLVAGVGWISDQIRSSTRARGESPSITSHVGLVVRGGDLKTAVVQEAVRKVRRTTLAEAYGGKGDRITVFRPVISDAEKQAILRRADETYGSSYGYGKICLWLLDHWIGRILVGREVYVFRRFAFSERPICSSDLADCWLKAGLSFGVAPERIAPDDIDDFCRSRPDKYRPVIELCRI